MATEKKGATRGKKNKKTSKKYTKYKVDDNKVTRAQHCQKCGPGMFLGIHKDRKYCGCCGYTEFTKK